MFAQNRNVQTVPSIDEQTPQIDPSSVFAREKFYITNKKKPVKCKLFKNIFQNIIVKFPF